MKKSVCFTIDIEPDFGGVLKSDMYFGKKDLDRLEELINKYDIKLTAFITGKTLEDNPEILEKLLSLNVEVESHSYYHTVGHVSKIEDISRGIQTHKRIVGKAPLGYRAPQGIITKPEVEYLIRNGIKYDSSIFPTFFPGRFNRLEFPTQPFYVGSSGLLEIPFSVIPKVRIPIGLSYMQLLGFHSFKILFKIFGLPGLIIYDFHSYELGKVPSYNSLPIAAKLGYLRSQKLYKDPSSVLEEFIIYLLEKGYESKYMIELYEEVKDLSTEWTWSDA